MNNIIKSFEEFFKDPTMKNFMEANYILFNAPSVVYITVPKKRILYNIFDTGAIKMSVISAAKEHGIDSIPAYEVIKYPDIIRKYVKVPDDEDIICLRL